MNKTIPAGLLVGYALATACCQGPSPAEILNGIEALRLEYDKDSSERAIERYRQALARWQSRDTPAGARAAYGLGKTYQQLGRLSEAARAYAEALAIAQVAADRLLEAAIRSDLGYFQAWLS